MTDTFLSTIGDVSTNGFALTSQTGWEKHPIPTE